MQVEPDGGEDWTRPGVYDVDPGVYRIPLPLPTDGLRAVNVYALATPPLADHPAGSDGAATTGVAGSAAGGAGLVLVDSGWAITEAREALDAALDALGYGVADVRRFLITHVHRDHYSMAVAVRREFGNPISLGAGEAPAIALLNDPDRRPLAGHAQGMRRNGANELADWLDSRPGRLPDPDGWTPPDAWLEDETELAVGTRTLRVVATPGHTRGHVVFVDGAAGLLFAGDHVLPHITPSIGFEAVPAQLPLGDYLSSLRRMREMPDRRLLPAHGPVGQSVHRRVDELLAHHGRRLDQAEAAAGGGATAYEVAQRLTWTRREYKLNALDNFNQILAISETAAHLDLLVAQGRLTGSDVDGVHHYAQG